MELLIKTTMETLLKFVESHGYKCREANGKIVIRMDYWNGKLEYINYETVEPNLKAVREVLGY